MAGRRRRVCGRDLFGNRGRGAREIDAERCALIRLTFDSDVPICLLNNSVRRGQAKSSSFAHIFGGKERFKDTVPDFRGHPYTRVTYLKNHKICGESRFITFSFTHSFIARGNRQEAAFRHRVSGIDGQVHDQKLDLGRVRHDRQIISTEVYDQLNPVRKKPLQHLPHFRNKALYVHYVWSYWMFPAESQQLASE